MSWPKRTSLWLVLLVAAAAGVRIAAAVWWQAHLPTGQQFGFGDSESYWQLARSIARGKPYTYPSSEFQVFRSPGYPLLLAPIFAATAGDPPTIVVRAYSALLSALGVGGVFWLGKELFNSRVAWLAAIGVACDPTLVALGALLLSDGPCCALLPFQMVFWIKAARASSRQRQFGYYLAAGAMAGVIALVRPSWLLFTPFAIGAAVAFSASRKKHLLAAPWLLLGLAIVMAPWWVRNYRVTGHFVPTTLQVGASLYDGLNPQATGASNMDFTAAAEAKLKDEYVDRIVASVELSQPDELEPFEYELNKRLKDESLAWATAHPVAVLRLAGVKLLRMWNIWPNEPQFRQPLVRIAVVVSFVPTFVLATIGLWRFRALGWPVALLVLPAIYFSLLHMIFVSSIRYRLPAMVLLYVLAAGVIVDGWKKIPDAKRKS
jgi:4-amino-4-deoxy-L-arabinose transferase-like glycosyltransferase